MLEMVFKPNQYSVEILLYLIFKQNYLSLFLQSPPRNHPRVLMRKSLGGCRTDLVSGLLSILHSKMHYGAVHILRQPFFYHFKIVLQFWQLPTIDDHFHNSDNCFCHFDNWKDNPGNLLHLRHWLQFWQLRTWIHDNLCYLTINCDTGQHSQFLRCYTYRQYQLSMKYAQAGWQDGAAADETLCQYLGPLCLWQCLTPCWQFWHWWAVVSVTNMVCKVCKYVQTANLWKSRRQSNKLKGNSIILQFFSKWQSQ